MIRLPGKQHNTFKYYYDGHLYHCDSRNPMIFRCSDRNRGCQVTLYSNNVIPEDAVINCVGHHNHLAEPHSLLKLRFLRELLEAAKNTFEDPKNIFETTLRKDE